MSITIRNDYSSKSVPRKYFEECAAIEDNIILYSMNNMLRLIISKGIAII